MCKIISDDMLQSTTDHRGKDPSPMKMVKQVVERGTQSFFVDGNLDDKDLQEEIHDFVNKDLKERMSDGNIIFVHQHAVEKFNRERSIPAQRVCAYELPNGNIRVMYKHEVSKDLRAAVWTGTDWFVEDMMRTETKLTANLVHAAKASALAEAGIWYTIAEMLDPQNGKQWKADGSHYIIDINQETVRINIHNEAGKINLNIAQPKLIEGLLRSVDVPEDELPALLNAILDWRDKDNLVRQEGAEDEQYNRLDYEFGAKDGPFNTLDELQLVMGMTPALYRKMEPALTLYSSQPGIQIQTAPQAALLALPGLSPEQVDKILAAAAPYNSFNRGEVA